MPRVAFHKLLGSIGCGAYGAFEAGMQMPENRSADGYHVYAQAVTTRRLDTVGPIWSNDGVWCMEETTGRHRDDWRLVVVPPAWTHNLKRVASSAPLQRQPVADARWHDITARCFYAASQSEDENAERRW